MLSARRTTITMTTSWRRFRTAGGSTGSLCTPRAPRGGRAKGKPPHPRPRPRARPVPSTPPSKVCAGSRPSSSGLSRKMCGRRWSGHSSSRGLSCRGCGRSSLPRPSWPALCTFREGRMCSLSGGGGINSTNISSLSIPVLSNGTDTPIPCPPQYGRVRALFQPPSPLSAFPQLALASPPVDSIHMVGPPHPLSTSRRPRR
mmetsp:Transcript_65663/g.207749  ORF Transcript_65663/g.207749 Transcript_65663/m.207749 type:complete len:201 (+) Transcript_65663:729-1331(+)